MGTKNWDPSQSYTYIPRVYWKNSNESAILLKYPNLDSDIFMVKNQYKIRVFLLRVKKACALKRLTLEQLGNSKSANSKTATL